MKLEILSLSVTFVYDFENCRGILNSLLKSDALMFWKMAVFESQLMRRKFHKKMIPLRLVQVVVAVRKKVRVYDNMLIRAQRSMRVRED